MKRFDKKAVLGLWGALLLCPLVFSSCVSLKGYREVKAQMLAAEIEISELNAELDEAHERIEELENLKSNK